MYPALGIIVCMFVFRAGLVIADQSCVASLNMKFYRALQVVETKNCDSKLVENLNNCIEKATNPKTTDVQGKRQFLLMFLNHYNSPRAGEKTYLRINAHEEGTCTVSSPHQKLQKSYQLKQGSNKIEFDYTFMGPWYGTVLENKGILLKTSVDVSVRGYLLNSVGGIEIIGFSILPMDALSTSYTISTAIPRRTSRPDSFFGVVASEDDTKVTIKLPTGIKYRTGSNVISSSGIVNLNKQQTIQVWVPEADATGTIIKSNKPIGVFSSSYATCLDQKSGGDYGTCCNLMTDMMPPINTFAKSFLIPLSKKTFIRLIAGSSKSTATVSIPGSDGSLTYNIEPFNYADVYKNVKENPMMVKATEGILVTLFNSEAWWGGNHIGFGNIVIPSVNQYLSAYEFYVSDLGKGNSNFVRFDIIDVIVPSSAAANLRLDSKPLTNPVKQVKSFGYVFSTYKISAGYHTMKQLDGTKFGLFVFQSNGATGLGIVPGRNLG